MEQLLAAYPGKLKIVYRDFPLGFHDRAIPAAIAANCAGEQDKYWDMHGVLMENQTKLSDSDLAGFAQGVGVDMDKWTACLSNPAQEAEVKKGYGRCICCRCDWNACPLHQWSAPVWCGTTRPVQVHHRQGSLLLSNAKPSTRI